MSAPTPPGSKRHWQRLPLMLFAIIALLAGLWAGLLRIGWPVPPLSPRLLVEHGPLMISGFLGTLISLERAVALSHLYPGRRLFYLSPLLAGVGTVLLFMPLPSIIPRSLVTVAALGFVLIFILIYRIQPSLDHAVMGSGALLWLVGNGLWLPGLPLFRIVPWWAGFLILTIAGERLELARILLLRQSVRKVFVVVVVLFLVGLLVSLVAFDLGMRLAGLGLVGLGSWLLIFDIARRTIRQKGLTRFIAACLLPGYVWLLLSGLLWLALGGQYPAGPLYDAMLHTIFVGFVFSMIFGHAPVIIPAVMGIQIPFTPLFYLHLGFLHLSLALRIAGDLLLWLPGRRWGGLLNELAIVLFLLVTAFAALRSNRGQGLPSRIS